MVGPFDKRAAFFKAHFDKALKFSDYIATGNASEQERWSKFAEKVKLTGNQQKLLETFTRQINVLVISGTWCGDCIRQCPMVHAIESASSVINCRFIDNEASPELRDELRVCGGARVPVAVFLSEDFFEVTRFGDRPISVYRRKALTELGPACELGLAPVDGAELSAEIQDWTDVFERVHLMLRLSPFLRQRHND